MINEQSFQYNDQLFLAGYSEGGYATLAAQSGIEQLNNEEFHPLDNKIAIEPSQDVISVTSDGKSLIITTTDISGSYIIYNIDKKTNKIISTIRFEK